jgi:hypothetical protein
LFSGKQSFAREECLVFVAALAILAALVDSVVTAHTDPCFGRFVGFQVASSEKEQIVVQLDALAVEDIAWGDTACSVAEV